MATRPGAVQSAAATAQTSSAGSASKSAGAVDAPSSPAKPGVAGGLAAPHSACISCDELLLAPGGVGEMDMRSLPDSVRSVRRESNAPATCSPAKSVLGIRRNDSPKPPRSSAGNLAICTARRLRMLLSMVIWAMSSMATVPAWPSAWAATMFSSNPARPLRAVGFLFHWGRNLQDNCPNSETSSK